MMDVVNSLSQAGSCQHIMHPCDKAQARYVEDEGIGDSIGRSNVSLYFCSFLSGSGFVFRIKTISDLATSIL